MTPLLSVHRRWRGMWSLVIGTVLSVCQSACAHRTGQSAPSVAAAQAPSLAVPGIPRLPDVVTVVPFQLWYGVKHDWKGAWVRFLATIDGQQGYFNLDTGAPQFWLNRDSLPPNPRFARLRGGGRALSTVHTEQIGTVTVVLDTTVGMPFPMPSNAQVGVDYDTLGTNKTATLGRIGYNGMEPFEVIIDYIHQRMIWIRLDQAGRRMAAVPAYTPAATIPLVPVKVHLLPTSYPAEWWGIEVSRGGEMDTLLVDSGTQTETGLSEVEQRLAADQLHQAALRNRAIGSTLVHTIALPESKAMDMNVLGYFFLHELGVVGFNIRARQLLLYR